MPEPIPPAPQPEAPKPQSIIIGETPIYLTKPQKIGEQDVSSLVVHGADKRAIDGPGSAVILVKEVSRKKGEEGVMVDKPMTNLNNFDEVPWEKVSGLQWTDAQGSTHVTPKEELSFEPKAESPELKATPAETPTPEEKGPKFFAPSPKPEAAARAVLETLKEDPNTITIVGLKAYETRAHDLADRAMQVAITPRQRERYEGFREVWERTKDTLHGLREVKRTIWKHSLGTPYFHEKYRQYYLDMLRATETPFAEESIRLAEARAQERYQKLLADKNVLARAGTKFIEWAKDNLGMRTAIQAFALEEIAAMKVNDELRGLDTFEREAVAVRLRFSQDIDAADRLVRQQLGEKLEILDPTKEEHKPIVEGIQNLIKRYASGEIADKAGFDAEAKQFFATTLKDARPDIFAEAELYSSSLFDVAETVRAKASHEGGLANLDAEIAGLKIRLGLGQMGEVTSLEPTVVKKGVDRIHRIVDWLEKKGIIGPFLFNEVTVGSGVALLVTLKLIPQTLASWTARTFYGLGAGAAVGGLFAGLREYRQLHKDFLTHLREREVGTTFSENLKRRAWFEKFYIKQRSADELLTTLQSTLYEKGTLKASLTDAELRTTMATLADLASRKAVGETGPRRLGLIQWNSRETIESQRTALDVVANKTSQDLAGYFSAIPGIEASQIPGIKLLGGNSFEDFMVKLTTAQTQVLKEGVNLLANLDDPLRATLGIVAPYAPEITLIKRRWPLASREFTKEEKAAGIDKIFDEFRHQAAIEATKYGLKAGVVGAGLGVVLREVFHLAGEALGEVKEVLGRAGQKAVLATDLPEHHLAEYGARATVDLSGETYPVDIGGHLYDVPQGLIIDPNPDGTFDARWVVPGGKDIGIADNVEADELFSRLQSIDGLTVIEPHAAGDPVPSLATVIPGLESPVLGKLPMVSIPEGFELRQAGNVWEIIQTTTDAAGKEQTSIILDGLKFNPDGSLANYTDIESKLPPGWHLSPGTTTDYPVPPPEAAVLPVEPVPPGADYLLEASKFDPNQGLWGYFAGKVGDVTNHNAAVNGIKNLFRGYEYYFADTNADGVPDNVDLGDNPYGRILHARPATFGAEKVQELDIAHIPDNAVFTLPKELFADESIIKFGQLSDVAIAHYQQILEETAKNPMDVLHQLEAGSQTDKIEAIVLKLGYFGRDTDIPTKDELALLWQHLSGVPPAGAPTEVVPLTVTLHQIEIGAAYPTAAPGQILAATPLSIPFRLVSEAGAAVVETPFEPFPLVPLVLLPRRPLERLMPTEVTVIPMAAGSAETIYFPFAAEGVFLTKEAIETRRSPRLSENPEIKLDQNKEIAWYFSTLSEEEKTLVAELSSQHETPPAPELRAAVAIPVSGASQTIYQTLSKYVGQADAEGKPWDPKAFELVVYDVLSGKQTPDATRAEVERFKTEHPDFSVIYLSHIYPETPGAGRVKRDLTNFLLQRISTRPVDAPEVAVMFDPPSTLPLSATYLSTISQTLDSQPSSDLVYGRYQFLPEAYQQYPSLFAASRAYDFMDSMVRHGENRGLPPVVSGNFAIRAGTLAAVGNYNPQALSGEDLELTHLVNAGRKGRPGTFVEGGDLSVTLDPKELLYQRLQMTGLADKNVPLTQNETYKDAPWQDLAKKLSESATKDELGEQLTVLYQGLYPGLKEANPEKFEAYFKRTLDRLGLNYELKDGKVTILNDSGLAEALAAAELDLEAFGKQAAEEVRAAFPEAVPDKTPHETLEALAEEQAVAAAAPSSPLSPPSPLSSPELSATAAVAPTPEAPPPPEPLPAGVEERIAYVLSRASETSAAVELTPGELWDYLKTSLDVGGTRLTEGQVALEGDTLHLTGMKARTPVGVAEISLDLKDDHKRGLVPDPESLKLNLPLLARPLAGRIRKQLDNLNELIAAHLNSRLDPAWTTSRLTLVGDKLQIQFTQKA